MQKSLVIYAIACLYACTTGNENSLVPANAITKQERIAGLHVVDCLLPGQVRNLGNTSYLTPRRPVKTTASDCSIRGGEYVAYDRADYKSALAVWLPAAEAGDADAQVHVGEIFERGLGDQPNYQVAAIWYQQAADQGNRRGQFNLGTLYEQGLGVKKDRVKALDLYRQAWGLPEDHIIYQSVAKTQQDNLKNRLDAENQQIQGELTRQLQAKDTQIRALQKQLQELQTKQRTRESQQVSVDESVYTRKKQEIKRLRETLSNVESERNQAQRNLAKQRENESAELAQILQAKNNQLKELEVKLQAQETNRVTVDQSVYTRHEQEVNRLKETLAELEIERSQTQQKLAQRRESESAQLRTAAQLERNSTRVSESVVLPKKIKGLQFGRYFALIIGNQNYDFIQDLQTPYNDARKMADLLKNQYGFKVTLLINADRVEVMEAINAMNEKLTENDNLLIYYAGHGNRVPAGPREKGYWLPVNADPPPKDSFWVSNEFVTGHLGRYKAKRVLVVADSCYAGLLSTSPEHLFFNQELNQDIEYMRYKLPRRARLLITSGGDHPVIDSGGQGHSVFAKVLLDTLRQNNEIISAPKLFLRIRDKVRQLAQANQFSQIPDFKSIKGAGHEVGDFFFVPKGG